MAEAAQQHRREVITDAGIAIGAVLVLVMLTTIASEEDADSLDLIAYALAASVGVAPFWRRNHPSLVAVASLVIVFGYHALGYPAIGSIPLAFAVANAPYHGATRSAIAVAVVAVFGALAWFLWGEDQTISVAINFVIRDAGVLAAAVLLGSVLRSRRRLAEESKERIRLARAEQEARMTEERMAIAREIHDVLAHTVALIGVQAKVAIEAVEDNPEEVRAALKVIKDSTDQAAAEVRATIGVLRSSPSKDPAPGFGQVGRLVESMSSPDLSIELTDHGSRYEVSDLVGLVAYRVIQEALTNVVKHARASHATVRISYYPTELMVAVTDDGIGGEMRSGFGVAGMKERVKSIGGSLTIGAADSGGVQVAARLPTGDRR